MELSELELTGRRQTPTEARFEDLQVLDVVSYSMAHNRISIVRSVTVTGGSTDLDGAVITIELRDDESRLSKPFTTTVDIAAGRETVISNPELLLDAAVMSQVAEQRPGELVFALSHQDREILTHTQPVQVLAARQWLSQPPGLCWELLPSFVLPNAFDVTELINRVTSRLRETTGSSSIEGYQSGPKRVDEIVRACWEELLDVGIAYAEPPASWGDMGQKVRTPNEVVSGRVGTCLDTTVLLAALLEQAGIRPVLWAMEGHILLGWWRVETTPFATAATDASPFYTMMDLDALEVIETTALTRNTPFQEAIRLGRQTVRENQAEAIVDVFAARRSRILPLPAVRRLPSGQVEEIHYIPTRHSVAPSEQPPEAIPSAEAVESKAAPVPQRVRMWKNSLLDLSLRNRLINYSERSGVPLILSPGVIAQLEDRLHNGRSVALRAMDDIDHIHAVRTGVNDARTLPPEVLTDLFVESNTLHVRLPLTAYQGRLLKLAHRARTIQEETGANNLYLTLGTLAWKLRDRELRSPLILVPVTLEPAGRKQGLYRIALDDTGTSTPNFCLLEKLRSEFGVTMPTLANPPSDKAGIDLQATFKGLSRSLADHGLSFHVEESVHLSVLMFGKFRLWKDLDEHWEKLTEQPLVKHLTFTPTHEFRDPTVTSEKIDLDRLSLLCPIPADSSQLCAIAEALAGRTMVLEGPPGTGKSQTIANLLARCIAEGKRVLFVAEKRAALDVVRDRVAGMGLANFALDLHDKASRPVEVRRRILASMDTIPSADLQGLEAERSIADDAAGSLRRYRDSLHQDNGAELSLYSARARLLALGEGPVLIIGEDFVRSVTPERLAEIRELLRHLPSVADPAYPSSEAPWLFVGIDDATALDVQHVRSLCLSLDESLRALRGTPTAVALDSCRSAEAVRAVADFVAEPALTRDQLAQVGTPAWEQSLHQVLRHLEELAGRAHSMAATPQLWNAPVAELAAAATNAAQSGWWGRRKRLRVAAEALSPLVCVTLRPDRLTLPHQAQLMAALAQDARTLTARILEIPGMVLPPDWNPLAPGSAEIVTARAQLLGRLANLLVTSASPELAAAAEGLTTTTIAETTEARRAVDALEQLLTATGATQQSLSMWFGARGFVTAWQAGERSRRCSDSTLHSLTCWVRFREALQPLLTWGLIDAHAQLLVGTVPADTASTALDRGLAVASLEERRHTTGLDNFDASAHERTIRRYVDSSSATSKRLPPALAVEACQRRSLDSGSTSGRVGELRRLLSRQRGGLSVREMMERYGELITQFMPCFLMSPDSLARFLPVDALTFDLVVFDEASQIRVADAIGAMGRARSVAVVGDSMQMPPTSFAEATLNLNDEELPEDEFGSAIEDEESILNECVQARVQRHWLSWHYRSQHESLIAFSNNHYYEGRLSSFPTPVVEDHDPNPQGHGISLIRVDGRFLRDGKGSAKRTNPVEAEAVVAEIIRRFTLAPAGRVPSLGVVTFNQQQRTLIERMLRECDDDRVHDALDAENGEGLFVKNLENVQGDERDVILFSVAFSRNDRGILPLNFGPLNLAGGERRLNVAITRARRQVLLYCSFDPTELRAEETSSVGVKHLKAYLELAQHGTDQLTQPQTRGSRIDRHREDIAARLRERGWAVRTDVGLSDFRIDIVVSRSDVPDKPVMAVLLDGAVWADRRTVSDRDGLPVTVLKATMGWPVVKRVWLPSWLADPDQVLEELEAAASEDRPVETEAHGGPEPSLSASVCMAQGISPHDDVAPLPTQTAQPALRRSVTWPPEAEEFTPWSAESALGLGMDILDHIGRQRSATHTAKTTLGEIITHEGPVQARRAAALFSKACGLGRLSSKRLETILAVMPSDPDEYGFLWASGQDPTRWRGFRPDPEHQRSIDEISPHELANAMREACHRAGGLTEEQLYVETLRTFGFQRRTANAVTQLEQGLIQATSLNRIRLNKGYYEAVL